MRILRAVALFTLGFLFTISVASAEVTKDPEQVLLEETEEDKIHILSVYNFLHSSRRLRTPRPVLVTVTVKGKVALEEFCEHRPRILESVLRVYGWAEPQGGLAKSSSANKRDRLLISISNILPEEAVQDMEVRMASDVKEFGPALLKTRYACKALEEK
jgi:hypothetical protein